MWEKQYQSLKLFGEGCGPPIESRVAKILAERRAVMTELLCRLCKQEGANMTTKAIRDWIDGERARSNWNSRSGRRGWSPSG